MAPPQISLSLNSSLPQLSVEFHGRHALLVDRGSVSEPGESVFDAGLRSGVKMRDGRGQAFRVSGSFGDGLMRHYRRGGLTGALWQDRYPFWGLEQSRPFRELRLLATLYARGLPVPRPIAARLQRSGFIYRADLLTQWLEGARPLSGMIRDVNLAQFQEVGQMLARFHRAGLFHADLNAHNVLQTDQGMALIDFDRCEMRSFRESWSQDNIARLFRSLTKLGFAARGNFASELWPALLSNYRTELQKSRESGTTDTSRESGTTDTSRESGTTDTSRASGTEAKQDPSK